MPAPQPGGQCGRSQHATSAALSLCRAALQDNELSEKDAVIRSLQAQLGVTAAGTGGGPASSTITPSPSPEPGLRLLAGLSIGKGRRDSGSMSYIGAQHTPGTGSDAAAAALAAARASGTAPPGTDPGRWSKFIKAIKFTGKEEGAAGVGPAGAVGPLAAGSLARSRSTSGSSKVPPALGAAGEFELVSAADALPFISTAAN
jgi:hypothetical protein